MIIKKIKFNNFRPFKGEQQLDFSCDDDKNVVVVLAQNTAGKTTIVLSFIWCFYGDSKFEDPMSILNKDIANNMSEGSVERASVEVELEHEGKDYTIKRVQSFKKQPNGMLTSERNMNVFRMTYIDENGETQSCGQHSYELTEAINSIMPEDLSEFFFFEGEKSNNVVNKDISEAVKKILGLDTYTNMMSHLYGNTITMPSADSVMGGFRKRIESNTGNTEAVRLSNAIKMNSEELDKIINSLEKIDDEIKQYEDKIEDINEMLRSAAPAKEIQALRDKNNKTRISELERLDKYTKRYYEMFSRNSFNMFLLPLIPRIKEKLKSMDLADKGITGIEVTAINELIKRQTCLCGTCLVEGTKEYENVISYRDILPPKSVGILVKDMMNASEDRADLGLEFYDKFNEIYEDIQLSIKTIDDCDRQEKECLSKLALIGDRDISSLERDLSTYKIRRNDLLTEKMNKSQRKGVLEKDLQRDNNRLNELKTKSDANEIYNELYDYANELYEWVKSTYKSKEVTIRSDLEKYFQELFNEIYSGEREVRIDEKYNLKVYVDGRYQALTGGLHIIKYFAFVGALVKLARDTIGNRNDEDEIFGEHYPLVLDAAFSHADDVHTKAIAASLANVSDQLIFAVMKKDWLYAKDGIENKVKRMYEIEKVSETYSVIREIESR